MTQRAYPLDNTDYLAEDVRLYHVGRAPGLFDITGEDLKVEATGTTSVKVKPGYAYLLTAKEGVGGITFGSDAEEVLSAPISESTERYDYVAVRYSKDSNTCQLTYVRGTNTPPSEPVRTSSTYEIILAILTIHPNSTQINSEDIKDVRADSTFCGTVEARGGMYPLNDAEIDDAIG